MKQSDEHRPSHGVPFYLAVVFFGFLAIIAQIVFLREFLIVAYGNELYIAIIFTCWFAGISAGAFFASFFIDRINFPLRTLVILLIVQSVLAPIDCYLIRVLRIIFSVGAGEIFPFGKFFLATTITLVPFTILTGINFPLMCRHFYHRSRAGSGSAIGVIYWIESLGSIIGGAGFTFLLVNVFSSFNLLSAIAVLVSANTFFLVITSRAYLPGGRLYSIVLFCVFVILGIFYFSSLARKVEHESILKRWDSLAPGIRLIDSIDTKYQNLAISIQAGQYNISANGKFISAFPDDFATPQSLNLVFTQTAHPPRRILIIGGGNPELIYFALMHNPERIDYVELDDALIPFLFQYLRPEVRRAMVDRRVYLHYTDGRRFIKFVAPQLNQRYDIVWINVPDPSTVALNRFYTVEFYREVKRILADDGVVATQVSSAVNYFGEMVLNNLGSIAKTLSVVFPRVIATPGERAFLFATPASADVLTTDPAVLINRYNKSHITIPNFSPYVFYTLLDESQRKFVNQTLRTALPTLPLNSDLQPLSYFYNVALWTYFSGLNADRVFTFIRRLHLSWLVLIACGFLLLRFAYIFVRRLHTTETGKLRIVRFNGLFLLAATGFAGMAAEIIILILFQSMFGYLYQKVGLIVASFMLGLVIGGFSITKLLPSSLKKSISVFLVTELIFLLFLIGLFFWVSVISKEFTTPPGIREIMFYLFTMLIGVLSGIEFPLVGHILLQSRTKSGYTAAIVDSLDHLGATFGAFTTGIILIPALGIAQCFLALALLKLLCFVLLLFTPAMSSRPPLTALK
ncbi:hypothetical protein J7M23_02620 [Candidatus Sumerlaeota bacterium]|nr:hypothetical protein [Candidatus Sumerlaeota bacterium]